MYITNPFILSILEKVPQNVLNIIAIVLFIIFTIDGAISLKIVSNVRTTSTSLNKEGKTMDNTEEITAKVKEILRNKSILNRRLINAYPNLQATLKKKKEEIKKRTEEVKEDLKNKRKNK